MICYIISVILIAFRNKFKEEEAGSKLGPRKRSMFFPFFSKNFLAEESKYNI